MKDSSQTLNAAMLNLLTNAVPYPLGIKAALINQYLHRPYQPISPAALVNMESEETNLNLLDRYTDLLGYQFDWGFLIEDFTAGEKDPEAEGELDPDDFEQSDHVTFEFVPERLLQQFPHADILDYVFLSLYQEHSLYEESYIESHGSNCQALLSLSAFGDDESTKLRTWLAGVFLPKILPDLIAEVEAILDVRKTDPKEFARRITDLSKGRTDLQMVLESAV